jgi:serine/threonine protein phosphatase PrpC
MSIFKGRFLKKAVMTQFKKCNILFLVLTFFQLAQSAQLETFCALSKTLFKRFKFAAASLENVRNGGIKPKYSNQDRVLCKEQGQNLLFGVFDGHGKYGDVVARKTVELFPVLFDTYFFDQDCFLKINQELQKRFKKQDYAQKSGTTAVAAFLKENNLIVSNTGDSRLILAREGKVFFETKDHKPENVMEYERLIHAGAKIRGNYIYGKSGNGLAISRTIGDSLLHQNDIVVEVPDVTHLQVEENDFIVAASDGLFDVMKTQEVVDFVQRQLIAQKDLSVIVDKLTKNARHLGSFDDITALIIHIADLK